MMNRRDLLKQAAATAATFVGASALGGSLSQVGSCEPLLTPAQTKGPFYPVIDQLDTDADLVVVKGSSEAAKGKVILIRGKVADILCAPVTGALVEIWQACESGRYNHPSDTNTAPLDPNFQYWGKAVTDKDGNYQFRTVIPGAYPADTNWMRPPHVHFKVARKGYTELITQLYFAGETLNDSDLILQQLSKEEQNTVITHLNIIEGFPHPVALFNIVMKKVAIRE